MPKHLTFANHVKRSVPYDDFTQIARVIILRRGAEVMTIELAPYDGDARVSVASPGQPWRTSLVNDTDAVTRMWS